MSDIGFTINKVGNFPRESYEFAPIQSIFNPVIPYSFDFSTFYCRQPYLWLSKLNSSTYNTATNAVIDYNNFTIDYITNGKITYDALQAKKSLDSGYSVNYFNLINSNEKINGSDATYGYLFYPDQLVLTPSNVSKINNSTYRITLNAGILKNNSIYFKYVYPSRPENAPLLHNNYIKSDGKTIDSYPTNTVNSCSFIYSISATKSITRQDIINYSQSNQPRYRNIILENNNYFKKIRKDKTFFEINVSYPDYFLNAVSVYTLNHPDNLIKPTPFTFPFMFTNTSKEKQTFAFFQSAVNLSLPLGSSQNCILSSVLNLNSTILEYSCNPILIGQNNFKISYVVDSANMITSNQTVQSTVNSFKINNNTVTPLTSAIPSTVVGHNTVTYETIYPPHFYSYKISLISPPDITDPIEEYCSSFSLTSIAYRETTTSVLISTYLRDEFGKVNLDLETYGYYDKIKYEPDFLFDASLLNDITATIGTNTDGSRQTYDLKNPTWFPATNNTVLEITFPKNRETYTDLSIRPMLSNVYSGLNSAQTVSIIPIKGIYVAPPYVVSIKKIKEGNDYIDLSIEALSSITTYPFIDLRNSNVEWKINNPSSYVKLNYLKKNSSDEYIPIDFIQPNTTLNYDEKSWAIRLSGYGPITTQISLSSQKYNIITSVLTDPQLFDFYQEKKLIVSPNIILNNENKIRTITLSAYIPFRNRIYNLPQDSIIYWDWIYNGVYNETIPVTAKYIKNGTGYYEAFASDTAANIDKLQFLISPNETNIAPDENIPVTIRAYTADTILPYTGSYTLDLDTFPSKNIFNADFYITYQNNSVKLLETRNGQYVLTRRNDTNAKYTLTVNPDIISTLTNPTLTWTITNAAGTVTTGTGNTINYDATGSWKHYVNLKISGATVPGWSRTHTVEQNVTIYSLDSSVFDKQLKFISYPEYAWNNSDQVSILSPSNFSTIAAGTTAYDYKKSNTHVFYVSANVNFDRYVYTQGSNRKLLLDTNNDGVNEVEIPYGSEFVSSVGTKLYLSAFNEYFPSNTPLYYQSLEGSSLVTRSYNITAESIPYSVSTASNLLFFQNPKLVDYNGITHTFSAIITSFDLDVNRSVFIQQKFNTNPLNTPAKIQSGESTITYILSTPKWTVKKDIPAVDGIYNVFTIRPGDDLSPLRVKNTAMNTLYLNASSNLNIKIPESTFDTVNQGNPGLLLGGDFWNTKNITIPQRSNWQTLQAYTTSTQPEIFLNTAYILSGIEVFVEFNTPEYTKNPIISYAVNFGEGAIQTKAKDQKFYNTYTTLGTFYISYSAIYLDSTKKVFVEKTPFIIKKNWDEYNKESIRIISEANLELPYSLNDISIQPNEFGDADIFNTCLTRIDENLSYLKNNIQTINSNAPSYYYGWMGSNQDNRGDGIRWYTSSYGSEFYETPNYASSEGTSSFIDIKDIHIGKYIYVLDDKRFRLFEKDKNCKEVKFLKASDMDELFFNPQSITLNDDETSIYVADSIRNKIYRFDFDFSDLQNPLFGLVLTVGNLGGISDNNKFDFPSEIFSWNDNVFVLDYNNNCIKQYSGSLSWIHTYYDDVLQDDQIVNFTVHENGLLYVITKNLKVHIFDELAKSVYTTFNVDQIGESEIVKISFDENGEFLYVTTTGNVFKYSSVGEFLTTFNLPNINGLKFTSCKHSSNRELYISTNKSILKFQDFVELFKIGDGLDSKYWSQDQILLKKEEFATDINYNLALNRTAQNIKTFRNSLNAKFVLVSEQTARGTATYFSLIPILKEDNVKFDKELLDVENENLKIGVNEFYIPDVINRELKKLHDSQIKLRANLDVSFTDSSTSNLDGTKSKCGGDFCWSWRAMSCYDLSLPVIRLCNINPITYAELMSDFPVNYAPTKIWQNASSDCCNEYASPLI